MRLDAGYSPGLASALERILTYVAMNAELLRAIFGITRVHALPERVLQEVRQRRLPIERATKQQQTQP